MTEPACKCGHACGEHGVLFGCLVSGCGCNSAALTDATPLVSATQEFEIPPSAWISPASFSVSLRA